MQDSMPEPQEQRAGVVPMKQGDPAARNAGLLLIATALVTLLMVVARVAADADQATLQESLAAIRGKPVGLRPEWRGSVCVRFDAYRRRTGPACYLDYPSEESYPAGPVALWDFGHLHRRVRTRRSGAGSGGDQFPGPRRLH